ncbi:general stress protein [Kaistella solincola]|uniref:Bacillithiol system protein YtxJ n=2 Tax=Kaistella TaxID=2782231 RepID=A0A1I3JWA3_9FLAO|nr:MULTISPECIES: bacillithiol system redox-active protein YtxJ [Kaistella]KIA83516.1 general stress protein [Kaistella solincola]SFI64360.1 bacillithiol system protein YtxJ [Kaistella treverensis]
MSFFDKIFSSDSSANSSDTFWKNIQSEEDLDKAIAESNDKKVVIFKHSTRCQISKRVLSNFESEVKASDKDATYYFLDLIKYRPISNKIADDLDVTHQSPQIIVLENGKAVKNASHSNISLSLV